MPTAYEPAGYCPRCGYRVDAGVCPECGRRVLRPARRDPRRWSARLRRLAVWLAAIVAAVAIPDLESLLEPETDVFAMFADLPGAMVVEVSGDEALIEYEEWVDTSDEPIVPEPGWAFGFEPEVIR